MSVIGTATIRQTTHGRIKVWLLRNLAAPVLIWIVAPIAAWYAANNAVLKGIERLRGAPNGDDAGHPISYPGEFRDPPAETPALAKALTPVTGTIARQNAELTEALAQRDRQIREIHHRVKNNLQIICSLINLQARVIADGAGRQALMAIRDRIQALSLIHRSLYETNDLELVELRSLVGALMQHLADLNGNVERGLRFESQVPEMLVKAQVGAAIAMLVTEAATNAIRHAFPAGGAGLVSVSLNRHGDGSATLMIADNGVGMSSTGEDGEANKVSLSSSSGLGAALMHGFARQLGGRLSISTAGGTQVRLEIPQLCAELSV